MLKEGQKAPRFELPSDAGTTVKLSDFAGRPVVVYFYPRDNTPGCTREAQAFAAAQRDLKKLGVTVLGVSKDSVASHCGFRDKYALNFPLLSDADLTVHKAFGAYGEKTMYGRKVLGTIRSTFVIDRDGKVAKVFPSVKVDGHVDAVLAALRGDGGDAPEKTAKKTAKKAPARKR
jgi:peroxiredoxin Q/BCP